MRARCLVSLALMAGCGRWGFDVPDGGSRDVGDAVPPAQTRILPVLGAVFVNDAAFDAAGNLAVIGDFAGSVTIGGMTMPTISAFQDIFLAVLDPTDTAIRLWTGGVTQLGVGQNLAWLPDGSIVTSGYFAGRLTNGGNLDAGSRQAALIATFEPAGTLNVAKHYGSSSNVQARGVAALGNRIAVVGLYSGSIDLGAGPITSTTSDNGFLATMDLDGTNVRDRAFTGNNDVFLNDVIFDPSGDVFLGGRFNATTDFGLGPVSPQPGGSSAFIGRFDANLAPRWVRTFGSASTLTNIELLPSGDCVAVGGIAGTIMIDGITVTTSGGGDGWVGRFAGGDGAAAWIRTLAGADNDSIPSVTVTSDHVVIAGQFGGTAQLAGARSFTSEGGIDGVIAGFDLDGALAWSTHVGGTGDLNVGFGGIAVDATGSVVAVPIAASGILTVDGQTVILGAADGAVLLVAIPPS